MRPRRSIQERLTSKRALLGLLQTEPNPSLAEMAGMCGYDFLMLDAEHGLFSEMDHLRTLQALGSTETLALVRLAGRDGQAVGRYLDMGADGIMVPNVATGEQAQDLVQAMTYPPHGTRGYAASAHRGTSYGVNITEHLKAPRAGKYLLPIIESSEGVSNVEQILAVEGVDGVIIGPSDLSADLGCAGDFSSPSYAQAVARIEKAANEKGKILGTAPHPGHSIEALLARGHRLLILGAEMPLIREAMANQVANATCFFK